MRSAVHPADVTAAVRKRGKTLAGLSREAGLSVSACSYALLLPSKKAEAAIIAATGLHPHTIWPDRYDKQGNRLIRRPKNRTDPSQRFARRRAKGQ